MVTYCRNRSTQDDGYFGSLMAPLPFDEPDARAVEKADGSPPYRRYDHGSSGERQRRFLVPPGALR
jgi:hypothetical protein